jgi:hypothetical protein
MPDKPRLRDGSALSMAILKQACATTLACAPMAGWVPIVGGVSGLARNRIPVAALRGNRERPPSRLNKLKIILRLQPLRRGWCWPPYVCRCPCSSAPTEPCAGPLRLGNYSTPAAGAHPSRHLLRQVLLITNAPSGLM